VHDGQIERSEPGRGDPPRRLVRAAWIGRPVLVWGNDEMQTEVEMRLGALAGIGLVHTCCASAIRIRMNVCAYRVRIKRMIRGRSTASLARGGLG
jgi:hypothetical protein